MKCKTTEQYQCLNFIINNFNMEGIRIEIVNDRKLKITDEYKNESTIESNLEELIFVINKDSPIHVPLKYKENFENVELVDFYKSEIEVLKKSDGDIIEKGKLALDLANCIEIDYFEKNLGTLLEGYELLNELKSLAPIDIKIKDSLIFGISEELHIPIEQRLDGLFYFELRTSDDEKFSLIEDQVIVNNEGCLISNRDILNDAIILGYTPIREPLVFDDIYEMYEDVYDVTLEDIGKPIEKQTGDLEYGL